MPLCIASAAEAPAKLSLGSGAARGGGDVVRARVLRGAGVPGHGCRMAEQQEQALSMGASKAEGWPAIPPKSTPGSRTKGPGSRRTGEA